MKKYIILPTYNEAENLPKIISAIFSLAIADLHLCIIDDNSPDGTGKIADLLASEYPNQIEVIHRSGKLGLGTAYIHGFQYALQHGAEIVGQMDSDFSHPVEKLTEMFAVLDEYDFVIGSRYIEGGSLDERWPQWRRNLSAFGNIYARMILSLHIQDATAGFRIWKRIVLDSLPLERVKSNGYAFQIEMAYLATKMGFQGKEIPIHFADRRWGTSKMSFEIQLEAAFRVWRMLLDYRDIKPVQKLNAP